MIFSFCWDGATVGLEVGDPSPETLAMWAPGFCVPVDALKFRDVLGDCVGVVRRGPSSEIALK